MPLAEYIARLCWFAVPLAVIVVSVVRRGRNDPRCMICSYSFAEHVPSQCPECGKLIAEYRVRSGPSFPYHVRMTLIAISSLVLALMPATLVFELLVPVFPTTTSELVVMAPYNYVESIGGTNGVQYTVSTNGAQGSPVWVGFSAVHGETGARVNRDFALQLNESAEFEPWIRSNGVDAWLDRRADEWEAPDLSWSSVKARLLANVDIARSGQVRQQPPPVVPEASAQYVQTRWSRDRTARSVERFSAFGLLPLGSFLLVIVVVMAFAVIRGGQHIRAKIPEAREASPRRE